MEKREKNSTDTMPRAPPPVRIRRGGHQQHSRVRVGPGRLLDCVHLRHLGGQGGRQDGQGAQTRCLPTPNNPQHISILNRTARMDGDAPLLLLHRHTLFRHRQTLFRHRHTLFRHRRGPAVDRMCSLRREHGSAAGIQVQKCGRERTRATPQRCTRVSTDCGFLRCCVSG